MLWHFPYHLVDVLAVLDLARLLPHQGKLRQLAAVILRKYNLVGIHGLNIPGRLFIVWWTDIHVLDILRSIFIVMCDYIHSATRLIELANKCLNGVSSLKSLLSTAKKMPMVLVANASTYTSECSRRVTKHLWVDDTVSRVANLTFYQST